MQPRVPGPTDLDELEQPDEAPLVYHGAKRLLFGPAVEQKEVGVDVELGKFLLLEEAVDELCSHIVAVVAANLALQEHLGTTGDIVFAVEVLVPGLGD
jgi:hypothetical protein